MKYLHTLCCLVVSFLFPLVPAADAQSLAEAMAEHLECYPVELVSLERQRPSITNQEVCLATIYHEMGALPLWVTESGPSAKARVMLSFLRRADEEGLDPQYYEAARLEELINGGGVESLAVFDTLLTYNIVKYIHDISYGQLKPLMVDPELFAEAGESSFDPVATIDLLTRTADVGRYLESLPPAHEHYRGLKEALAVYRRIGTSQPWEKLPYRKNLSPGDRDDHIAIVRERMAVLFEKPLQADTEDPLLYDETLEHHIELFQELHGLKIDAIIGRNTLAEINVSPAKRVDQIRINMARWRWQDHNLGENYILVNIADFQLYGYREGQLQLNLPVIVGQLQHQTPVFSDVITYIEINPFWNIPTSIAVKEDLPKLRKNPMYLVEKNIRLFSSWQEDGVELDSTTIDWSQVTRSQMARYKLRQDPGPGNALGRLKFVFPNHYSVYLHDTPARNLFAEHHRFFSHGCIRVSTPERLAEFIVGRDGWDLETIQQTILSGERKVIRVRPPLPIHLTYQTAWLDKSGRIHFNRDIYRRDEKLYNALLTQ